MRIVSSLLLILVVAAATAAETPPPDISKDLYDRGLKLAEEGRFRDSRQTLEALLKTWPKSPEALAAQHALDAEELMEDAEQRLKTGKYGTAAVAFRTLISVYPESPLVRQAARELRTAEELEQRHSKATIVRSLRFENIRPVTIPDILQKFEECELPVAVEKPFDPALFDEAKLVMAALLAERGVSHPLVQLSTRAIPRNRIEVTFRVVKN